MKILNPSFSRKTPTWIKGLDSLLFFDLELEETFVIRRCRFHKDKGIYDISFFKDSHVSGKLDISDFIKRNLIEELKRIHDDLLVKEFIKK